LLHFFSTLTIPLFISLVWGTSVYTDTTLRAFDLLEFVLGLNWASFSRLCELGLAPFTELPKFTPGHDRYQYLVRTGPILVWMSIIACIANGGGGLVSFFINLLTTGRWDATLSSTLISLFGNVSLAYAVR
jgi:hypothetical protein